MKIDTANIDLSSTHAVFEKNQMNLEEQMQFSNLFDNRLRRFQAKSEQDSVLVEKTGKWYERTTFQGQSAVQLSRQFIAELEKLRQIFDSILQRLNQAGRGCCMRLSSVDRISMNALPQPSARPIAYEYTRKQTFSHYESENTGFSAGGVVNTMDGRRIDFSFEMNLGREFFRQDQITFRENGYTLIDPLVVNLDASMPRLSQTRFSFDLDADGIDEDLPVLMPGSGFLSLDKNHDGIINDGTELFGPSTGHGFDELSQYDLDHNLWIDENDAIFDELTIWENDEQGQMQLTKIKEAGVGAIYLVNGETPFDLRDESNRLEARIRNSGIALNEDGSIRSLQEIEWSA